MTNPTDPDALVERLCRYFWVFRTCVDAARVIRELQASENNLLEQCGEATVRAEQAEDRAEKAERERDDWKEVADTWEKEVDKKWNNALEEAAKVVLSSYGQPWHYVNGETLLSLHAAIRNLKQ